MSELENCSGPWIPREINVSSVSILNVYIDCIPKDLQAPEQTEPNYEFVYHLLTSQFSYMACSYASYKRTVNLESQNELDSAHCCGNKHPPLLIGPQQQRFLSHPFYSSTPEGQPCAPHLYPRSQVDRELLVEKKKISWQRKKRSSGPISWLLKFLSFFISISSAKRVT